MRGHRRDAHRADPGDHPRKAPSRDPPQPARAPAGGGAEGPWRPWSWRPCRSAFTTDRKLYRHDVPAAPGTPDVHPRDVDPDDRHRDRAARPHPDRRWWRAGHGHPPRLLFVAAGAARLYLQFRVRKAPGYQLQVNERPFSYRALFAVVYTTSVSSVYFALGVVAHHANGLTPVVFLAGGHLLPAHRDDLRRGSLAAPGARRLGGLRPLRVQRAGQLRRRLGDRARLHDPARRHGADRAGLPGARSGRRSATAGSQIAVALGGDRVRGWSTTSPGSTRGGCGGGSSSPVRDLVLQAAVIVLGLVLAFHPHRLTDSIHLGTRAHAGRTWPSPSRSR